MEGYRTQQFVAFATGSLSVSVELNPGFYVPAYRFVDITTGQTTLLQILPKIQVV